MYRLLFLYFSFVAAELEMVQVLLRHGDRAPSFTYPFDTEYFDVEHYFPRGFSQLTQRGFDQAQELGTYLRQEYSGLVNGKFDRKSTLIRSSDKDRCIETAMGVAKTLFPDQIVPVHTYSHYKEDLLLKPNSQKCPKIEKLVAEEKKIWREETNQEYEMFFDFLSRQTGWKVDAAKIEDVYNVLYRKHANMVPQPDWIHYPYSPKNQTVLDTVVELKRQSRMMSFNSAMKSKLRTGYLLGQIGKNMEKNQEKVIVYASHDATVTSLMYSLGISDHQLPPYAAALIFELHKDTESGERSVKILYRNSTTSSPSTLANWPWSDFQSVLSDRVVENKAEYDQLCQLPEEPLPATFEKPIDTDDLSTFLTVGIVSILDFLTVWNPKTSV